jgi:S-adenosylhomocysteine hydrolase
MDGFKVVRIDEVLTQIDILITATGKLQPRNRLRLCSQKEKVT